MDEDEKEDMTVAEAAVKYKYSEQTIYRWIDEGYLGKWGISFGKRRTAMVKKSEIEALIASKKTVVKLED